MCPNSIINAALPSLYDLKGEARTRREASRANGKKISHIQALNDVAHRHGFKNWESLEAKVRSNEVRQAAPEANLTIYVECTNEGDGYRDIEVSVERDAMKGEWWMRRVTLDVHGQGIHEEKWRYAAPDENLGDGIDGPIPAEVQAAYAVVKSAAWNFALTGDAKHEVNGLRVRILPPGEGQPKNKGRGVQAPERT